MKSCDEDKIVWKSALRDPLCEAELKRRIELFRRVIKKKKRLYITCTRRTLRRDVSELSEENETKQKTAN